MLSFRGAMVNKKTVRKSAFIVSPNPVPDIVHLSKALNQAGVDVTLYTSFALSGEPSKFENRMRIFGLLSKRRKQELLGVRIVNRPTLLMALRLIAPNFAERMRRQISYDEYDHFDRCGARFALQGNYDIVVSQCGGATALYNTITHAQKVLSCPIISTSAIEREIELEQQTSPAFSSYFGMLFNSEKKTREIAELSKSDVCLVPTSEVKRSFQEYATGTRIEVCPFGCPAVALYDHTLDARIVSTKAPLKLVFAGQVIQRKGFLYLARALQKLDVPVELVVVGPAPFNISIFFENGFPPNVKYAGVVGRSDLARIFRESDAICLPSLAEGFPFVVLEALSSGCPAITTSVCDDLIRDQHNGIVVPKRDAGAIADAITKLFWDRDLLARMKLQALNTAQNFQWSNYERRVVEAVLGWGGAI